MAESDNLDNCSEGSIDDEVTLMSRNFKQMMKNKWKFQHSFRREDTRFKKKHKEESNRIIKKLEHIRLSVLS